MRNEHFEEDPGTMRQEDVIAADVSSVGETASEVRRRGAASEIVGFRAPQLVAPCFAAFVVLVAFIWLTILRERYRTEFMLIMSSAIIVVGLVSILRKDGGRLVAAASLCCLLAVIVFTYLRPDFGDLRVVGNGVIRQLDAYYKTNGIYPPSLEHAGVQNIWWHGGWEYHASGDGQGFRMGIGGSRPGWWRLEWDFEQRDWVTNSS